MFNSSEIKNADFIEKLKEYIGEDVILFGLDSMSYYGNLSSISQDNIAVLIPAGNSASGLVEIQNPAEIAAGENTTSIDICNVVAFGYKITADPFVLPDDNAEDVGTVEETSETSAGAGAANPPAQECTFCCNNEPIISEIKNQMRQLLTISTLGGFLLAGEILSLKEKLAKINVEYIFAPGGDGSTLFSIEKAFINLNAATAVSS